MRTYVYVDGFNLYHRALKNTPHKWLDLKALFTTILDPSHEILAIKYYTALVTGRGDPQRPIRQKSYLRALRFLIPELTIQYGHFMSHSTTALLEKPIAEQKFARIIKTEEKGSDVNLAVHLLNDSWLNLYDCAVVVSNDSDLCEAIRLAKQQHGKIIGVAIPWNSHPSKELLAHANFSKHIRQNALAVCQLPSPIPGTAIYKPASW